MIRYNRKRDSSDETVAKILNKKKEGENLFVKTFCSDQTIEKSLYIKIKNEKTRFFYN